MNDQERTRWLKVFQVAILAVEAYDPATDQTEDTSGLASLVLAYGKGIGVTQEEAQRVLYTSRLCDFARR